MEGREKKKKIMLDLRKKMKEQHEWRKARWGWTEDGEGGGILGSIKTNDSILELKVVGGEDLSCKLSKNHVNNAISWSVIKIK
jgi:hypothetical protein